MKKIILILLSAASLHAQYLFRSPYLQNTELMKGYVDSCARFWYKSWDNSTGGFYTNVDRAGNLITSWGTNKNMMTQSRHAYGQIRAFMMTGQDSFFLMAGKALDFMYAKAWDNTNGGWYWELNSQGSPTGNNGSKTAFYQHYALLGPAAMYEATLASLHNYWLTRGYQNNQSKLWDSRPGYEGYYDNVSANWGTKNGKSFNATVDAITTHALSLYLLTGDAAYRAMLLQLADNMIHRLLATMPQQQIGFAELYTANWAVDNGNTNSIMGHVLKTSWCLARLYELFPDTVYLNRAVQLFRHVYEKGYDTQYGGPYKDYNRTTGQMLMWGNPDTAKAWWQMEQAVTAGLVLYDITRDVFYLRVADETLDFFMRYFVDHTYGEVYENRERKGPLTWGDHKGNGNKASYHSIETGYYVYLYGGLFVHKKAVPLYYQIAPFPDARTVQMNPVEWSSSKYRIKEVQLNGLPFTQFTADTRSITIPANTGGKFRITYEPSAPSEVHAEVLPVAFALEQNFPNPFNPATTLRYTLPSAAAIRLAVFNQLGEEVAVLAEGPVEPGTHYARFTAASLPSGIYVARLSIAGSASIATVKMSLVK